MTNPRRFHSSLSTLGGKCLLSETCTPFTLLYELMSAPRLPGLRVNMNGSKHICWRALYVNKQSIEEIPCSWSLGQKLGSCNNPLLLHSAAKITGQNPGYSRNGSSPTQFIHPACERSSRDIDGWGKKNMGFLSSRFIIHDIPQLLK